MCGCVCCDLSVGPIVRFHVLQIKFFHKVGSMPAPVTDNEKLIWSVLEAERPLIRFSFNVHFALSLSHAPVCV